MTDRYQTFTRTPLGQTPGEEPGAARPGDRCRPLDRGLAGDRRAGGVRRDRREPTPARRSRRCCGTSEPRFSTATEGVGVERDPAEGARLRRDRRHARRRTSTSLQRFFSPVDPPAGAGRPRDRGRPYAGDPRSRRAADRAARARGLHAVARQGGQARRHGQSRVRRSGRARAAGFDAHAALPAPPSRRTSTARSCGSGPDRWPASTRLAHWPAASRS